MEPGSSFGVGRAFSFGGFVTRIAYKRAASEIEATPRDLVRTYLDYWETLRPQTHLDYYRLFLFAYASVRTRWQENVKIYKALSSLPRKLNRPTLRTKLRDCHAGMIQIRLDGIHDFHDKFWADPTWWYPQAGEPMVEARDRIVEHIHGLGIAKVSFVLEMAYHDTCQVVCIDTHIRNLYGVEEARFTDRMYRDMERHWLSECHKHKLPSPIVRHVYWDQLRGETLNRYWAHCLEKRNGLKPSRVLQTA